MTFSASTGCSALRADLWPKRRKFSELVIITWSRHNQGRRCRSPVSDGGWAADWTRAETRQWSPPPQARGHSAHALELQTKVVKLDSMSHLIVLNNCYFCMVKTSVVFKILTTPEGTTGRYNECWPGEKITVNVSSKYFLIPQLVQTASADSSRCIFLSCCCWNSFYSRTPKQMTR